MQKVKREFKGVWINREVWLNEDLTIQEKFLLVEIDSLDNDNSCFASNDYFAEFMGLKNRRVKYIIESLIKKGFLKRELVYKKDSKEIEKRLLKVIKNINGNVVKETALGVVQETALPGAENCPDSNTLYISTTIGKLVNNAMLIEDNAMKLRKTPAEIIAMVPLFVNHCVGVEKLHNNNTDLFTHFGSWLRKYDMNADASEEKIEWFINMFNGVSKGNFKATKQVRELFNKQLANGFTGDQMKEAVKNLYSNDDRNKWHKESAYSFATPTHFLKDDNVNKYLNQRF